MSLFLMTLAGIVVIVLVTYPIIGSPAIDKKADMADLARMTRKDYA